MSNDTTMRAWRLHEYGQPLDVLRLDEVPVPEPEAGEVRVAVQGIPLNFNDHDRITGVNMMVRPELPYSPGMEVMGVVEACGAGTEEWMGRRVVATTKQAFGGFAEKALCPTSAMFEMPEDIPLPGAAALYFPFHLAWLGLIDRAHLQSGESVLVHAAAGGAGSAAVQLAKDAGARVIATASTPEKLDLARELGADVALDYTDEGWADAVLAETNGKGVDVVFDSVGAAVWEPSLKALAYDGRFVMLGFASDKAVVDEPTLVPRRIALANMSLCGVMLNYQGPDMVSMIKGAMGWSVAPTELGARITAEIVERVRAGRLRPVVGREVAFEDLPAAIDDLANRRTVGRIVVRP